MNQAISPYQLHQLRRLLDQQRRFRLEQLDELDRHEREDHLDATDREITALLSGGARLALHDVLDALDRMDRGTFGLCVDCGEPLSVERLEVLPQVALCMPCQQAADAVKKASAAV